MGQTVIIVNLSAALSGVSLINGMEYGMEQWNGTMEWNNGMDYGMDDQNWKIPFHR